VSLESDVGRRVLFGGPLQICSRAKTSHETASINTPLLGDCLILRCQPRAITEAGKSFGFAKAHAPLTQGRGSAQKIPEGPPDLLPLYKSTDFVYRDNAKAVSPFKALSNGAKYLKKAQAGIAEPLEGSFTKRESSIGTSFPDSAAQG
jgi:hypothetical protein